jgi:hypothetical protein
MPMQSAGVLDTHLMCGVPVLEWHGAIDESAIRRCRQVIHSLAHSGYRELVLDLQMASVKAPRQLQRFLNMLDSILPAHLQAEVVLPAGTQPSRAPKRWHWAPSVALALSHLPRLPAASLQSLQVTHVRWLDHQG